MRSAPIFLGKYIMCLLLCLCCGAPPNQLTPVRKNSEYTYEENKFVIDELLGIDDAYIPIKGRQIWTNMEEKFRGKRASHSPGFSMVRTASSLRTHFMKFLLDKTKVKNVAVPEALKKKFIKPNVHRNKGPGASMQMRYTPEENDLIIKELSKPSSRIIYADSTWNAIKEAHDEKIRSNTPGFDQKRTAGGLRSHFRNSMQKYGLVPEEVENKINRRGVPEGAGTNTQYTFQNQQDIDEESDDDFWEFDLHQLLNESVGLDFTNLDEDFSNLYDSFPSPLPKE